jgi:hypothetical protein
MDAGEIGQLARPRQGADETFHLRILVNDPAVLDDGNAGEGVFHQGAKAAFALAQGIFLRKARRRW